MIRKSEYTIADIIYSKRRPLTTRFWVPPDREPAVREQFKRLMPISPAYLVKDLPIHGDMQAFVDAEIRKQYNPSLVRNEIDQTTACFDLDWVQSKIRRNASLEMIEITSDITHSKAKIESYTSAIEDMRLDISSWQADLADLSTTAEKRVERAKSLSNQISEIRADGNWEVLSANDEYLLFCNKYPFVLTEVNTGNMLQLGHWMLKIPLDGRYETIRLIPFAHNVKFDGYCHPNVNSNGFPCFGDAKDKIHELMQLFRLLDITRYFTAFMTEYTHYQPFATFQTFYEQGRVFPPWLINELIGQHDQTYNSSNYRLIRQVLDNNNQFLAIRAIYLIGLEGVIKPDVATYDRLIYKELYPDDCVYEPEETDDQEGMSEGEIEESEPFVGYIDQPLTEDELALRVRSNA